MLFLFYSFILSCMSGEFVWLVRLVCSPGLLSLRRCAKHHFIGAPIRDLVCCDEMSLCMFTLDS
jgi:hypothetical protein